MYVFSFVKLQVFQEINSSQILQMIITKGYKVIRLNGHSAILIKI